MKPPLRLLEALKIMDQSAERHGRPFVLVFCTADVRRDTGGERIVFDRAVLTQVRKAAASGPRKADQPRPARSGKRYPINVKNLTSGEIRRVRVDLIESVNGHPVL